jgi:D-beta-D-heptose 7-phosphate kinase/D-beta-D-heptose 1-phosphate adenosyltransferase
MGTNLPRLIDAFTKLNVLVLGDAMLDSYLDGTAERLCPEAPIPVVAVSHRTDVPGGAANTAANVSSLGGQTILLSVLGTDPEAELLRRALAARGVSTAHLLAHPARRTLAKNRVMASSQLLVRFDQGGAAPLDRHTEQQLLERLHDLFYRCDALIVSDYQYGVVTPRVIRALAELQRRAPRIVVVDAKAPGVYREAGVTAVKPNYQQALRLLGLRKPGAAGSRVDSIAAHGERLLTLTGAQIAAVTLDVEGALIFERGKPAYRTYARPAPHARAAGAGDTFVSALALALAAGAHTPAAAELASAAAACVVAQDGTVACPAAELREYVSSAGKYVTDVDRLLSRVEFHRQHGRRIVFTNGCFDLLHRGHITYLNRAKDLGDILIVGVNSDASVARLKGPGRPINALDDRIQVLAALSCIDYVVVFDEDTPSELIRAVRPDVCVKGGNYTRAALPEASLVEELGGTVEILPYVEDQSTTSIIERIRAAGAAAQHGRAARRRSAVVRTPRRQRAAATL